jgi:hypothetical protein
VGQGTQCFYQGADSVHMRHGNNVFSGYGTVHQCHEGQVGEPSQIQGCGWAI